MRNNLLFNYEHNKWISSLDGSVIFDDRRLVPIQNIGWKTAESIMDDAVSINFEANQTFINLSGSKKMQAFQFILVALLAVVGNGKMLLKLKLLKGAWSKV